MAKDLQRAIDASVKASEAHTHLDQKMYMSAKHLESAAFFAKDLKRPDEAARAGVRSWVVVYGFDEYPQARLVGSLQLLHSPPYFWTYS